MLFRPRDVPSITKVRQLVCDLMEEECDHDQKKSILVMAVDGVPFDLASRTWSRAHHQRLISVFPSTSSTAWLSSLTGLDVDTHGVPGVVFRVSEHTRETINIFNYSGPIEIPYTGNIFSDAAAHGYRPVALSGDFGEIDCTWRKVLLDGATCTGMRYCTIDTPFGGIQDPDIIARLIEFDVRATLAPHDSGLPVLIWCFVDLDQIIHVRGYDEIVIRILESIDCLASNLTAEGFVVVGYSDHGLVRTQNDPSLANLILKTIKNGEIAIGGAGRVRWFYPKPGTDERLLFNLKEHLPNGIEVDRSDSFYRPGSLAHRRAGSILLIANNENFLNSAGYLYEHGSLQDEEMYVPFSRWTDSKRFS